MVLNGVRQLLSCFQALKKRKMEESLMDFTRETQAFVYGLQLKAVQRMCLERSQLKAYYAAAHTILKLNILRYILIL